MDFAVSNDTNKRYNRICPICNCRANKFLNFGIKQRADAQCPSCGSLERHRFLWIYLKSKTNLLNCNFKKVLHISPEKCLEIKFRKQFGDGYITADLYSELVMIKMDITKIEYPDETFDIIICCHVLEHIIDDWKALKELFRVLKNGGLAIIIVPITVDETYEDETIIDETERLKAFGQNDHVRRYGYDFTTRLSSTGFKVAIYEVNDIATALEAQEMGINNKREFIFQCSR
jgi:predicted SAM-dependent methyltransferase